jgi:hypothetical protein
MFDILAIFVDGEIFPNGKIIEHKITVQEMYFTYFIHELGYKHKFTGETYDYKPLVEYSENFCCKVKEGFLKWQSKRNPVMNWITKNYNYQFNCESFDHLNDMTWNDLDKYIEKYFLFETHEIGCQTKEECLREQILINSENEFPF